jgi:peptidyl-prolyl cis-trans isomerase SurA
MMMTISTQFLSVSLLLIVLSQSFYQTKLQAQGQVQGQAQGKIIDRIVAIVNTDVITMSDLDEMSRALRMQIQSIRDPIKREEIYQEQMKIALDELINQKLVLQEAKSKKIQAEEDQIDAQIANIINQQGSSEEQLQQYLNQQGMSMSDFRKKVADGITQQMVMQSLIGQQMQFSEQELKSFYVDYITQNKASYTVEGAHILISVLPNADAAQEAAAKQQCVELIQRIKKGESFEELAKKYSKSAGAEDGGNLGIISRGGGLPPVLENAFLEMKEGEISEPVRSDFGYHILKVLSRKELPPASFESLKPQLEQELRQKKYVETIKDVSKSLRAKAFVEIKLNQANQ